MSPRSFLLTDDLSAYVLGHSTTPSAVQAELIAETAAALGGLSQMQISAEQGVLMGMLVRISGARNIVEVGTFTGYSALSMAMALPADGRLLCCDISEEWTVIARRAWERAGVADRIELRIAPALDTLRSLPRPGDDGFAPFDLAFIDADKPNYVNYYEEIVPRLRPGGLLLIDNVLWSGTVIDSSVADANTLGVRAINDHVIADPRVEVVIIPIGDGLSLVRLR